MKILHCADLHLGSKIDSKYYDAQKSKERKSEILHSFGNMITYAKNNGIKIILLSGDVFDKDNPTLKDKQFFYKAIKKNTDIDFLYLNGNHDKEGSYVESNIPNLKTFNKNTFTYYYYDNVCICGIELDETNCKSFYNDLSLNPDKLNIVMLHGELTTTTGINKIKKSSLANKNIDYLALGHIHSYSYGNIDNRGVYAYPGCLEPRGFDECEKKGFIVLDIDEKIEFKFIPFSQRTIHEVKVDVTGKNDLYEIKESIADKLKDFDKKDIISLELTGELPIDVEFTSEDINSTLSDFYIYKVTNNITLKLNIDDYKKDSSLIGEFIRTVFASNDYSEDEKKDLMTIGLKVLQGKEFE